MGLYTCVKNEHKQTIDENKWSDIDVVNISKKAKSSYLDEFDTRIYVISMKEALKIEKDMEYNKTLFSDMLKTNKCSELHLEFNF